MMEVNLSFHFPVINTKFWLKKIHLNKNPTFKTKRHQPVTRHHHQLMVLSEHVFHFLSLSVEIERVLLAYRGESIQYFSKKQKAKNLLSSFFYFFNSFNPGTPSGVLTPRLGSTGRIMNNSEREESKTKNTWKDKTGVIQYFFKLSHEKDSNQQWINKSALLTGAAAIWISLWK